MDLSIEEYINKYINIVKNLVGNYIKKVGPNIEIDDLYSTGLLALVESYYSYDREKGAISTHVYNSVKYSILNYISKCGFVTYVPKNVAHYARIAYNENKKHLLYDNRPATSEELRKVFEGCRSCRKLNLTDEFFLNLLKLNEYHINHKVLSYEMLVETDNNNDNNKRDKIYSADNVEEEVINSTMLNEILEYIETLPEDEKLIIRHIFGLNSYSKCSSREIAKKIRVTHQTVCNRYNKILEKIRGNLNI